MGLDVRDLVSVVDYSLDFRSHFFHNQICIFRSFMNISNFRPQEFELVISFVSDLIQSLIDSMVIFLDLRLSLYQALIKGILSRTQFFKFLLPIAVAFYLGSIRYLGKIKVDILGDRVVM